VTVAAVGICILCQLCLVGGHLLLKHAMNATHAKAKRWGLILSALAGGASLLCLWFFLWLGLLGEWDLSQIFPFDGMSPPLLVLSAWIFLKERASPRVWVGVALIGLGIGLVSQG
jgi:uncharacterized membrane protein